MTSLLDLDSLRSKGTKVRAEDLLAFRINLVPHSVPAASESRLVAVDRREYQLVMSRSE